jgi:hypothetical protein
VAALTHTIIERLLELFFSPPGTHGASPDTTGSRA